MYEYINYPLCPSPGKCCHPPLFPVFWAGGNGSGIDESLGANFCPVSWNHGHTGTGVMAAGGRALHTLK